jgi:PAS domain S-box-containing protein
MPVDLRSNARRLAGALSEESALRQQALPAWARYGLTLLVVAVATGARLLMDRWLPQTAVPYVTFYTAVALTTFLWGRSPGIVATLASVLACDYFISPPRFSFALNNAVEIVPMLFFLAGGLLISVLAGRLHATRHRANEQRQMLAVTLASIGDGVIVTDAQGRVTFINHVAEQLTGWPGREAQGQPLATVFHIVNEDTRQPVESPVEKVLRLGAVVGLANHTLLIAKDGREIPIDDSGAPIRQSDGTVHGVVLVFRDFSQRRAAEKERACALDAAQASERLYRAIGESIDYGIWICDAQGRNTYASESFLKLVGISQEQCSNLGWGDVLHPDDVAATIAAWMQCVQTGGPWYREHRFRGADGQWHPILACGVPVRNDQGVVTAWAGINLDISRIKQAENALREMAQRLAYHVDNSPLAVIEWGPDMRLTRWSGEAQRMFGWTPQEVLGKRMEDFRWIYHEDQPLVADVSSELQTGANVRRFSSNRNYRKDGTIAHCEWYNSSLLDASGKLVSILSLVLDVTDRKKAEEALHQLNASLEQRVAERTAQLATANAGLQDRMDAYQRLETEVARLVEDERLRLGMELHDNLCQQLAAVGMQTATLARRLRTLDPDLSDTAARIAATLGRAGDDAHAMSRGLLPVQVQADGLMVALAGLAQRIQDTSGVACVFECAAPVLLQDNATATHLFRIAQEAVHNAIKHGQPRHIVLSLSHHDRVALSIADDGVGIPPADKRAPGAGLRIMAYRARVIGADLRIDPAPNGGTLVQCVLTTGASAP